MLFLLHCNHCQDGKVRDGKKVIMGAIPKHYDHPDWPYLFYIACPACCGYWEYH